MRHNRFTYLKKSVIDNCLVFFSLGSTSELLVPLTIKSVFSRFQWFNDSEILKFVSSGSSSETLCGLFVSEHSASLFEWYNEQKHYVQMFIPVKNILEKNTVRHNSVNYQGFCFVILERLSRELFWNQQNWSYEKLEHIFCHKNMLIENANSSRVLARRGEFWNCPRLPSLED